MRHEHVPELGLRASVVDIEASPLSKTLNETRDCASRRRRGIRMLYIAGMGVGVARDALRHVLTFPCID